MQMLIISGASLVAGTALGLVIGLASTHRTTNSSEHETAVSSDLEWYKQASRFAGVPLMADVANLIRMEDYEGAVAMCEMVIDHHLVGLNELPSPPAEMVVPIANINRKVARYRTFFSDLDEDLSVVRANKIALSSAVRPNEEEFREAEAGNSIAQMYITRWHLERGSLLDAIVWYERASDAGDTSAKSRLAALYAYGSPPLRDDEKATRLIRELVVDAQEFTGYARARTAPMWLAERYETGRGVDQDLVTACKWYMVAASFQPSPMILNRVERIKSELSRSDIETARARAGRFIEAQLEVDKEQDEISDDDDASGDYRPSPSRFRARPTGPEPFKTFEESIQEALEVLREL